MPCLVFGFAFVDRYLTVRLRRAFGLIAGTFKVSAAAIEKQIADSRSNILFLSTVGTVRVSVRACVHACVRACVHACVRACVHA